MLGELSAQRGRGGRAGELAGQLGQPAAQLVVLGPDPHQRPVPLPGRRVPLVDQRLGGLAGRAGRLAGGGRRGHRRAGRHRRHPGHRLLADRAGRAVDQVRPQRDRLVDGLGLLVRPERRLQLGLGPHRGLPGRTERRHRPVVVGLGRVQRRPHGVRLAGQPLRVGVRPQQQSQRALVARAGQLTAELLLLLLGQRHRAARPVDRLPGGAHRAGHLGHPGRGAHPGQPGQVGVERGQRHRGLARRRPCPVPLRYGRRDRPGQLPDPVDPGGRGGQRRVVDVGQPVEHPGDRGQLRLGLPGPLGGPLLHVLVDPEAEQVDQDLLPGGRLGVQEVGELPLRQHHAGGELLVGQPDRVQHGLLHLGRGAGEHLAQVLRAEPGVQLGDVEPGRHQLQAGVGGLDRAPAVPADHPGRHVPVAGRLEDQPDPGLHRRGGERVGQPSGTAPAGHRAVEDEADRVQHRRLARAGRPDQGEEVGVGEVDGGLVAEDGEAGQVQPHRSHQRSTSSSSSSKRSRTPSSSWPRLPR